MMRSDALDVIVQLLDRARRERNVELAAALDVARADIQEAMNVVVQCVECGHRTTRLEASLRFHHNGLCSPCGGVLRPLARTGFDQFGPETDELLQALHRADVDAGGQSLFLTAAKHIEFLVEAGATDVASVAEISALRKDLDGESPREVIDRLRRNLQTLQNECDEFEKHADRELDAERARKKQAVECANRLEQDLTDAKKTIEELRKSEHLDAPDANGFTTRDILAREVKNAFASGFNARPNEDRLGGWQLDGLKPGVTEDQFSEAFAVYLKLLQMKLDERKS